MFSELHFWPHYASTHCNFELVLEDVNGRDCRCIDRCGFMRSFLHLPPSDRNRIVPARSAPPTSPITAAVSSHKFRTEFVGDVADVASVEEEGDGADQSAEGSGDNTAHARCFDSLTFGYLGEEQKFA